MFERFTERAQHALGGAADEARRLGHAEIATEHLLLGLLRERDGLAALVLDAFGVTLDTARGHVARTASARTNDGREPIPHSHDAKRALEAALREALELGHHYIGTEHVLLGVLRGGDAAAARLLRALGVDPAEVRAELLRMLGGPRRGDPSTRDPAVAVELERLAREKEAAIEAGDFERAALARDRERRLAARTADAAWDEVRSTIRASAAARNPFGASLVRAAATAVVVSFAAGIAIGWLIWG